jgi:hypothetical protein
LALIPIEAGHSDDTSGPLSKSAIESQGNILCGQQGSSNAREVR